MSMCNLAYIAERAKKTQNTCYCRFRPVAMKPEMVVHVLKLNT